jgi:peptidoglycan-N-acetylglucosamine deacetylase
MILRRLVVPIVICLWVFATQSVAQQIAITFDDLPAHGPLPPGATRVGVAESIVGTLKAQGIPPTYGFVNGIRTADAPATMEVLKVWRTAGNPLGSHTWSHMNLNEHTAEEFEADIARNEPLLQSLMAGEPAEAWHWFRYPYLWEGDTLEKRHAVRAYLQAHGYRVAQVNMDFEDYLWNEPYARCVAKHDERSIVWLKQSYLATAEEYIGVYRETSKLVYGRDIPYVLLLHVGAFDAKMLPDLIALYRAKGFRFVSLAEAEKDPSYGDDPDLPLKYGGTLLEQMVVAKKLKVPPNSKPDKELEAVCR